MYIAKVLKSIQFTDEKKTKDRRYTSEIDLVSYKLRLLQWELRRSSIGI